MNARHKIRFRRRQYRQIQLDAMKANRGEPIMGICRRCGKRYLPEWLDGLGMWSRHCENCFARNMFDGLGMKTPPALIDKYTLNPQLL